VAVAIDRLERTVDWRVERVERSWAGLRSFAPDRLPVYGFDPAAEAFFWFAGQGGFGIQTAPAAAKLAAAAILGRSPDPMVAWIDPAPYAPGRLRQSIAGTAASG
jgi:D-arginine dehydrogenase